MVNLEAQIWNLSDGTLATLTNITRTFYLDRLRTIWSRFLKCNHHNCSNWMDAWKFFLDANQVPYKERSNTLLIDGPISKYIEGL